MPPDERSRREAILEAARVQFTRYGFRRTSMQDIARETGVSRASLYSHFANKEAIFRALSETLFDEALSAAEDRLKPSADAGGLASRVESALVAKWVPIHRLVADSPHGAEIMDENSRLCGDVVASSSARFQALLASAFESAAHSGEIDLDRAGLDAESASELVRLAAAGLKQGVPNAEVLCARLRALVRVLFAGLEPR